LRGILGDMRANDQSFLVSRSTSSGGTRIARDLVKDGVRTGSKDMGTVLVVEDYDDVRRMLKVLLESEKFRVLEAATGSEALDVIKNQRPDVILMDLALPGFDGLETIRRIRVIDGFQNTPIIVLTAYTGPSTSETAFRAGSNYFMAKPIDFDELSDLLKNILSDRNTKNPKYTRAPSQRAVLKTKPPAPRPGRELEWRV